MWAQYRKTLLATQLIIALLTCAAWLSLHDFKSAVIQFFIPLQACAVFGAIWATRLKRRLQENR
jgi:hypothetical protein